MSPDGPAAQLARANGVEHADFLAGVPATMGLLTGRLAEPTEPAALIAFLLSPLAANITGADYLVDGGFVKTG